MINRESSGMHPGGEGAGTVSSGVRRVNNLPLYIVGGAVLVFALVMVIVVMQRGSKLAERHAEPETVDMSASNTSDAASKAAGDLQAGIIGVGSSAPAMDTAGIPIVRVDNPDAPPVPPGEDDTFLAALRAQKLQQLQQALAAKSTIGGGGFGKAPPPLPTAQSRYRLPGSDLEAPSLADHYQQQHQASQASGERFEQRLLQQLAGRLEGDSAGATNDVGGLASFDAANTEDRWLLPHKVQGSRTAYELRAGFVVPAVMISGINSQLQGQVMAQVSQDVFDTATGHHLLIPQGARLVGSYSRGGGASGGGERLLVAWQRIVFPDGRALDLGAMSGADSAGYAGFKDQVTHHFWRTFGSALMMSAVVASISSTQDRGTVFDRPSFGDELDRALGQQVGNVMTRLIERNLNIAPTLNIRPGYRFNVMVSKDIPFEQPYTSVLR